MKPYVNFPEFEKNAKVQKAFAFLREVLFPKIGSAYHGERASNKQGQRDLEIQLNKLDWEGWNRAVIAGFNLRGKDKALFLGHSRRWAGTSLT